MIIKASCLQCPVKKLTSWAMPTETLSRSGGSYTWNPFIYISLSQTLKVSLGQGKRSLHMPSKNKILWPFDDQGKGDFLEAPRDLLHSLARASESWKAIVTSFLRVAELVILLNANEQRFQQSKKFNLSASRQHHGRKPCFGISTSAL